MIQPHISHTRWFLVFWLFVLSAVAFLDRVNISIAGSSIATDYGLTNQQLGWVFSSFLLGYALFQTAGGWLSDKLGPRRVLTVGVVWWGIFTALTAVVPSQMRAALLFFVAIRFLLGAGEAVIYPASNQFVSWWIPTQERGIANGIIFAGVGVGAGITPPAISYVMFHYGWRSSFWMSAIIGLAAGLVWFLIARDKPEDHPSVTPAELRHIQSGRTLSSSQSLSRSTTTATPGQYCQILAVVHNLAQQKCLGRHLQLFLLRLRRLDFLQLVLHLSRKSSRPESESQRLLRHASFPRHGRLLSARRSHRRPRNAMARQTCRTLWHRRTRHGHDCALPPPRLPCR